MDNYFAFIDESGVLDDSTDNQPFFAVGLLRLQDTSLITENLTKRHYDYFGTQKAKRKAMLKELKVSPKTLNNEELNVVFASTRHHEYKFFNISPTTLTRYLELLDTALKYPLYFCAIVIDKTDPLFDKTFHKNYWEAYIQYSKLLCSNNCTSPETLTVIADYMTKPRDSDKYFEQELNKLPNITNTLRAHSETFTLLQVCDLLLGSVVFQWRQKVGHIKNSNRARAKKEFVEYLLSKLTIPETKNNQYPLSQSITINRPFYLSVWPLKLSLKKDK